MLLKKIFVAIITFLSTTAFAQTSIDDIVALKFESIDAYEAAISNYATDGFTKIKGFDTYQSMKSIFKEEQIPDGVDENLPLGQYDTTKDIFPDESKDYSAFTVLSELVNKDKIVIIGNWIVKIDLDNQRGLVLNTSFINQYKDILKDNISNPNIHVLNMEDDGIEILRQLETGNANGLWCKSARRYPDLKNFYIPGVNNFRLNAKAVYQRAIFLFSLEAKAITQKRKFFIWWRDDKGDGTVRYINLIYHRKCSGSEGGWVGAPCQAGGCVGNYSSGSICSYRPYLGSRGLMDYDFSVIFNSTHGTGTVHIESL